MRNIIKHNDDFNERTNIFIKIYLSHFILERLILVVCERWVGDGDRLLYWPQVLLRPLQHFFLILAELLNRESLRAQALSLQADSHAGILSPIDSSRVCPGYIIV